MRRIGTTIVAITGTVLCASCRKPASTSSSTYDAAANSPAVTGIVAPLADDSSADIVSWVDGKPITDWTAEIAKRQKALDAYLNDADPAHAEKYGFRSGQNPRLAWAWFRDNPVGFNGVPFVLLKTILDLDPNHSNPSLRAIARIWKHQDASVTSSAMNIATR